MSGYFHHILLVDTDEKFRQTIIPELQKQGFLVSDVDTCEIATDLLIYFKFSLIIIEVLSATKTQIKFIETLKSSLMYRVPIIGLIGLNSSKIKIKTLENGADDCLAKPIDSLELVLKMKNFILLYEYISKDTNIVQFGCSYFNIKTKTLMKDNKEISLTTTELSLLKFLIESNSVVSRDKIAKYLDINSRSVDVQVNRLRNKIEDDTKQPQFLQTIRNEGYILHLNF